MKKNPNSTLPKFTNAAGAYVRMMFEQILVVTQSMCCLLCFQKYAVKYADKYSEQKQQKTMFCYQKKKKMVFRGV